MTARCVIYWRGRADRRRQQQRPARWRIRVCFALARGRPTGRRISFTAEMLAPRHLPSRRWMAVVMGRKRKTAAERLRQEIERAKVRRPLNEFLIGPKPDWRDPQVRAAHANAALSLKREPARSPIREAFRKFQLDPLNPLDWNSLLAALAACFFECSPPRPRGAGPKWDERRRMLFETHKAMARKTLKASASKQGLPPPTDELVADYLRWKWPDHYGAIAPASIRKYLVSGPPKGRR